MEQEQEKQSKDYDIEEVQISVQLHKHINSSTHTHKPTSHNTMESLGHSQSHHHHHHHHHSTSSNTYDTNNNNDNNNSLDQQLSQQQQQQQEQSSKNSVALKVGLIGDAQIGKTSLMVKYVEGLFDEDYTQTLGVNFMEKSLHIKNNEITFSVWDLGGQKEFINMLPLVSNDAVAILFMFDLTRKSTLNSIKEWYRQARGFNKTAIPFLIGTKYDLFVDMSQKDQKEVTVQAMKFAKAMKASLIFCSTSHSVNVQKIFKIILSKAFDLKLTIPEMKSIGEPILIYNENAI